MKTVIHLLACYAVFFMRVGVSYADLAGYSFGIDPGHGGSDSGAYNSTHLVTEKSVNLDTSLYLRDCLQADGADVYLTRMTDTTLSLTSRTDYWNSIPVDRGISVHHNAVADSSPNFTGVHVYPGEGWNTAGDLAYETAHRLNDHMQIGFVWSNCTPSREGVHEDNFHMVRESTMPSVLTENSFVSNHAEAQRLKSRGYLQKNGWALYAGVCDYFGISPRENYHRIVDNVDVEFTTYSLSGHPEYWHPWQADDQDYYYTYTNGDTVDCYAQWRPDLAVEGFYEVYACFWSDSDLTVQLPFTLHHLNGTQTVDVDQRMDGTRAWREISLGTFPFGAGTAGYVEASDATGEPYDGTLKLNVDVVMFNYRGPLTTATPTPLPTATPVTTFIPSPTATASPLPTPTPTVSGIIIDDTDAGCQVTGASWDTSSWGDNWGSGKHFSSSGDGSGTVTWSTTVATPGYYDVLAWVNDAGYTTAAHYTIHAATGDIEIVANQSYTGGGWCIHCGNHLFPETLSVSVSDDTTGGIVVADAVRFILTQPFDPTPTPFPTATPIPTQTPGVEARGIWVTRWNYSSPQDIQTIVTNAASSNFNMIFFQVRGVCDAYYQSSYEPWAAALSGTLGQDPGWDPLATAITHAHNAGVELHAWVNTFTCWSGTTPPPSSTPEHVYNAHPEWLQCDTNGIPMALNSGYVCISPGVTGVQNHISNVASDIVSHYDVDGIHFDYIRYAGPQYSHDPESEQRFVNDNPLGLSWEDWQRDQITRLVGRIYGEVTAIDPAVKVTSAVWGIYKDYWGWNTSEGYYDYYQDSQRWLELGYQDALCPMIYWGMQTPKEWDLMAGVPPEKLMGPADWKRTTPPFFDVLLDNFIAHSHGRHIYAGMHGNYSDFGEIEAEIDYTRQQGGEGNVVFAYTYIVDNNYWDDYANGPYALEAACPLMPWKYYSPTPTVTRTVTPVPSPSSLPTELPTGTPTATPEPTVTATPEPTITPTPEPTSTATVTLTRTPDPTATMTPLFTPTATPSPTAPPMLALTVLLHGVYESGTPENSRGVTGEYGITVELRDRYDGTGSNYRYYGLALDKYGALANGPLPLDSVLPGDYFLVVAQVNHLGVITEAAHYFDYGVITSLNLSDFWSVDYTEVDELTIYPEHDGMRSLIAGNAHQEGNQVFYVNVLDAYAWVNANGATPSSPNWDIRADFDANGFVNVLDAYRWIACNGRSGTVLIQPLLVMITSPADGFSTTAEQVTVIGRVNDNNVTVDVNGIPATVNGGTFFVYNLPLPLIGDNIVMATARDARGTTALDSIVMVRE